MKLMLTIGFIICISCSSVISACEFDAKSLYGGYIYEKGQTLIGDFELNENRTFNSWLHDRPSSSGTWELKDGVVTIYEESDPSYQTDMKVIKLTKEIIVVRFDDFKVDAQFKRVE